QRNGPEEWSKGMVQRIETGERDLGAAAGGPPAPSARVDRTGFDRDTSSPDSAEEGGLVGVLRSAAGG
ncbi:MAG: hypothetical protein ACKOFW_09205, partial [Planctomycetaceae bacterium]